jgi:hypothetical protein
MSHDIDDLFGLKVKTERTGFGKQRVVPPPAKVMAVLTNIAFKREVGIMSKRKARLRRNKMRRIEKRNTLLRRNVYRSIGEAAKRGS